MSYDLRLLLTEYMGFWHFYHHTYGYTIKWEKFLHLFLGLTDFWQTIKSAVGKYIEK